MDRGALFAVAVLVGCSAIAPAAQAGPECLLGTWVGDLENYTDKNGAGRKLVVTSVAPDGGAAAAWGFASTAKPSAAQQIKVKDDALEFLTSGGSKVEVKCAGPSHVSGSFSASSRTYFFKLAKQ